MSNFDKYSDYIIYIDESGDANWRINPEFPILCLNFCIFHKETYIQNIIPAFNRLKFKYWGSDNIVFHERDFRNPEKVKDGSMRSKYQKLKGDIKELFMQDMNNEIEKAEFHIFSVLIDKQQVPEKYKLYDPYHICLSRGLRQVHDFLKNKSPDSLSKNTHFVFEKRGDKEDRELCEAFNKIKIEKSLLGTNTNYIFDNFYFELMHKQVNSIGLQIADLTARPIANNYLTPHNQNRAYEIFKNKLYYCDANQCHIGKYDIVTLK